MNKKFIHQELIKYCEKVKYGRAVRSAVKWLSWVEEETAILNVVVREGHTELVTF